MEISDKMNTSLIVSVVAVAMAFTHWALSLFFARKTKNYFAVDLKQLWQDSLPFLKTQWPIVTIAMIAAILSRTKAPRSSSNYWSNESFTVRHRRYHDYVYKLDRTMDSLGTRANSGC